MNNLNDEIEVLILNYRLNKSMDLEEVYQSTLSNLRSGMSNLEQNISLSSEESAAILSELSYPGTYESLDGEISERYSNVEFESVAERDLYEQESFTAGLRDDYYEAFNNLEHQELRENLRDEVFTILSNSNSVNSVHEEVSQVMSQLGSRFEWFLILQVCCD